MPCLLCGHKKTTHCAVFIPKNQASFAAPSGKVRTCLFALCRKCAAKADWPAKAEDKIGAELGTMAARN